MKYLMILTTFIALNSCVKEKTFILPQFTAMGTNASLTLVVRNQNPYELLSKVKNQIQILEKILSRYDSESEVSKFNLKQGIVKVSPILYEVISLALKTHFITKVFDITLLPVIRLWDYKKGIIPTDSQIKESSSRIGSQYLELLPDYQVRKIKPVEIDLGGIAKGYAVLKCYELLREESVSAGIIRIGGEIYAFGQEWKIGIMDPKTKKPLYSVSVKDKAVSTSGDYERFFIKGNKTFSHIIDPRSLKPAEVIAHGVTVIGEPVIDSIPTSFFILGPQKSFEILKKNYPQLSTLFIMPDGNVLKSEYFPYPIERIKK